MYTCPKCGTESPDEARFCRGCGTPIIIAAASPAPATPQPSAPASTPVAAQPMPVPTVPPQPSIPMPPTASGPIPAPAAAPMQPPTPTPTAPSAGVPQPSEVKPLLTPEQQEKAKAEARAFGEWFKTFVTKPSETGGGKAWYGIAVILATTAISALTFIVILGHIYDEFGYYMPYEIAYYVDDLVTRAGTALFFGIWLGTTAFLYATLGCLRLTRAIMASPDTFASLHDGYAHRLSPWTVSYTAALLLALVHLDPLALAVWSLASWAQSIWVYVLVWEGESRRKLDGQWLRFLTTFLMAILQTIISIILTTIVAGALGLTFMGAISNVLS
ncbi:zinc ribbon domain-containing protein [Bifidobacterium miconisargentati]|uniref:zinc ribbon domain-containing protein n=1 Tax=Bifidobacterium miconisargentati TaxID=2834437 RepID=UPI001BDBCBBE|nr:zinc ribbon domain-containing protein [Bifidobacterium miconisargentati]MBW3090066.1 zinc ribbon domain-containing protein [Bifidobacterium miconisargentati]